MKLAPCMACSNLWIILYGGLDEGTLQSANWPMPAYVHGITANAERPER